MSAITVKKTSEIRKGKNSFFFVKLQKIEVIYNPREISLRGFRRNYYIFNTKLRSSLLEIVKVRKQKMFFSLLLCNNLCTALHFLLHYQHSKATTGRAKCSLGRLEVNHSPTLQMCVNVQPQNAHADCVVSVLPLPVLFSGARKELKLTRTLFSLCLKSSSLAYFIPLLAYYS